MDGDRMFSDRSQAGYELGRMLEPFYRNKKVLVLGIPRGGVVVAYEVARILEGELSVVITKKLPHPLQVELAIGACAEDGSVFLTSLARNLDPETVQNIVEAQTKEIESRIDRFRDGKPLPEMKNRIVIIVDDGIATGSTIVPAIKLCKSRKAAKVVVAAPVSGEGYVSEINSLADEVVIVEQPTDFYAVGQVYQDFHHLSDREVTDLLHDYEREFSVFVHDGKQS
jgi:putative phosphoribosyl transferase